MRRPRPPLSVIVATIESRRETLARTIDAYRAAISPDDEIVIVRDRPNVGAAFAHGLTIATGEVIHLTSDDVTPIAPEWRDTVLGVCAAGELPAPPVYRPDGTVESCGHLYGELLPDGAETTFPRSPSAPREVFEATGPFPPTRMYADYEFGERARLLGHTFRVCYGAAVTHHNVTIGKPDESDPELARAEELEWLELSAAWKREHGFPVGR